MLNNPPPPGSQGPPQQQPAQPPMPAPPVQQQAPQPAQPQQPYQQPYAPPAAPPPQYQPVYTEPPALPPASASGSRGWRRVAPWLTGVAGVLIAVVVIAMAAGRVGPFAPAYGGADTWTAVLLGNNEIFFGHIKRITPEELELTNVYYVQQPTSSTNTSGQAISIVSFVASQLQCPKDQIVINRADIHYWEDLQPSSWVVGRLNDLRKVPVSCYQPPATATPAPTAASITVATPTP